ncbi:MULTISPECIES: lipopolysaccharide biosynthesis protein [Alteromonadales]|uniref:lipopolysaccharide biosynthesis protein n=1 Tax=Alteromonadales TaxID=135622 RepID=UPI00257E0448|nr:MULTISPECIES: lipopolysaccharide biosynthesis protein [Alteromonadales]
MSTSNPSNIENNDVGILHEISEKKVPVPLSKTQRKIRKLKRDPKLFLADSKATKAMYRAWAKLGAFILVIIASLIVVAYYSVVASPRYVSQVQFVVKQASSGEVALAGLASFGATTPSMRDALILKEYIGSREMAQALNQRLALKAHYESEQWDWFSRLAKKSSSEELIAYFQDHLVVTHDELSEILQVEVQSYQADYSLQLAKVIMEISDEFINNLGEGMANQQLDYAQKDVDRAFKELNLQQKKLLNFQNKHELYSPEQKGSALLGVITKLETDIITLETEIKSLKAYLHDDNAEIVTKQYQVDALQAQLIEEKVHLTSDDSNSLNQINSAYQELKLNSELSVELYKSALASLEVVRGEAYKKLKYLLVVERPYLAEDAKYPRRLYSIVTWFVVLLLIYGVGRLVFSIIKEHQE